MEYTVTLEGGRPWGLRLTGGSDFGQYVCIGKVSGHSRPNAVSSEAIKSLKVGDVVKSINGVSTLGLTENEAAHLLRSATNRLVLQLVSRTDGLILKPAAHQPHYHYNHHHHQHQQQQQQHQQQQQQQQRHRYEENSSSLLSLEDVLDHQYALSDDGELSASTSDSQGSVIQIIGSQKQRLTRSPSPGLAMSSTGTWPSAGRQGHKKQVSFNLPSADSTDESSTKQKFPSTALKTGSALKSSTSTASSTTSTSSGQPMTYLCPPSPAYHLRNRDKVLTPFQASNGQRDQSPLRAAAANYRRPQQQQQQPTQSSELLADVRQEEETSTGNTSAQLTSQQLDRSSCLPITSGQSNTVTSHAAHVGNGMLSSSVNTSMNLERVTTTWSPSETQPPQSNYPQDTSAQSAQQQPAPAAIYKYSNRFALAGPSRPDIGRAYGCNSAKFGVSGGSSQSFNSSSTTSLTPGCPPLSQPEFKPSQTIVIAGKPIDRQTTVPAASFGRVDDASCEMTQRRQPVDLLILPTTSSTTNRSSVSWKRPSLEKNEACDTWSSGCGPMQQKTPTNAAISTWMPSSGTDVSSALITGKAVSTTAVLSPNTKACVSSATISSTHSSYAPPHFLPTHMQPGKRLPPSGMGVTETAPISPAVDKSVGQLGLPPADGTTHSVVSQSRGADGWSSSLKTPPVVATVNTGYHGYRTPVMRASSVENATSSGRVQNHLPQGYIDLPVSPSRNVPYKNTPNCEGTVSHSTTDQSASLLTNRSNSLADNRGPPWMIRGNANLQAKEGTLHTATFITTPVATCRPSDTCRNSVERSKIMMQHQQVVADASNYGSQHASGESDLVRQTAVWSPSTTTRHNSSFGPMKVDPTSTVMRQGLPTTTSSSESSMNRNIHLSDNMAENSTSATAVLRSLSPPIYAAAPSSCFRLDMRPASANATSISSKPGSSYVNRPFSPMPAASTAPTSCLTAGITEHKSMVTTQPFNSTSAAVSGTSPSSTNITSSASDLVVANNRPFSPRTQITSTNTLVSVSVGQNLTSGILTSTESPARFNNSSISANCRPFSPVCASTIAQLSIDNRSVSSFVPASTSNGYNSGQYLQQTQQSGAVDVTMARKVPPPVAAKPGYSMTTGAAVGRPFSPSSVSILSHGGVSRQDEISDIHCNRPFSPSGIKVQSTLSNTSPGLNRRPFSPAKRGLTVEYGTSFSQASSPLPAQDHLTAVSTHIRSSSPLTFGCSYTQSPMVSSEPTQVQQITSPVMSSSSPWSNSSRPFVADPVHNKCKDLNRTSTHLSENRSFSPLSAAAFPKSTASEKNNTSQPASCLTKTHSTSSSSSAIDNFERPLVTTGLPEMAHRQQCFPVSGTSKQRDSCSSINSNNSPNLENWRPTNYHPQPFANIVACEALTHTSSSNSSSSICVNASTKNSAQTGNTYGGNRSSSQLVEANYPSVTEDNFFVGNSSSIDVPFSPSLTTSGLPRYSDSTVRTTGYHSDSYNQLSPLSPKSCHFAKACQPSDSSSTDNRSNSNSCQPFSPQLSAANIEIPTSDVSLPWQPQAATTDNRLNNVTNSYLGSNPPLVCVQQKQQPLMTSSALNNSFLDRGVAEEKQRGSTASSSSRLMRLFSPPPAPTAAKELNISVGRAESCPPEENSTTRTSGTGCYRPVRFCPQGKSDAMPSFIKMADTGPTTQHQQWAPCPMFPNAEVKNVDGGKCGDVLNSSETTVSTTQSMTSEIGNITSKLSLMSAKLVFGADRGRPAVDTTASTTSSSNQQPPTNINISTTSASETIPNKVSITETEKSRHSTRRQTACDRSPERSPSVNNASSRAVLWKPTIVTSSSNTNTDQTLGDKVTMVTSDSTATVVRLFGDGKTLDSIGHRQISTNVSSNARVQSEVSVTTQAPHCFPPTVAGQTSRLITSGIDDSYEMTNDHRPFDNKTGNKTWNKPFVEESSSMWDTHPIPPTIPCSVTLDWETHPIPPTIPCSVTLDDQSNTETRSVISKLGNVPSFPPTTASSMNWSPTCFDSQGGNTALPWSVDAMTVGYGEKAVQNTYPQESTTYDEHSNYMPSFTTVANDTASVSISGQTTAKQITDRGTSPITIINVKPSLTTAMVTGSNIARSATDARSPTTITSPACCDHDTTLNRSLVPQTSSATSALTNGIDKATTSSVSQPQRCKSVTDWSRNGYHDDDHAYSDVEISSSWRDGNDNNAKQTQGSGNRPGSAVEKKQDSRLERLGIIYQGIGPKDKDTGVPTALRNSVSDRHKKDWYKQMYNAIHKPVADSDDKCETKLNGVCNNNERTDRSANGTSHSRTAAKIEDEPLKETSEFNTSFKKSSKNKSMNAESDTEVDYKSRDRNGRQSAPLLPSDDCPAYDFRSWTLQRHEGYKQQQKNEKTLSNRSSDQDRKESFAQNTGRLEQWRLQVNEQHNRDEFSSLMNDKERQRRPVDTASNWSSSLPSSEWTGINDQHWMKLIECAKDEDSGRDDRSLCGASSICSRDSDARSLQRPEFADSRLTRTYYGKARAIYTFHAQNPRELSFRKGDLIHLVHRIDKNWYEARLHGVGGIVPANYIEVMTSLEEARNAASTREGQGKAKYNFSGQTQLELSFRKGDILRLVRRVDTNWYEGRVVSSHGGSVSRRGIFPVNYVLTIVEPQSAPTTPVSSLAPSPLPDDRTMQSGQLSPVSSLSGPTRPSAPMSPVNFEDYSSDWDFDFESRTSLQRGSGRTNRSTINDTARNIAAASCPSGETTSHSTSHLDYDSRRRQDVNDSDGLFSFDEARRVLDELNERLRTHSTPTASDVIVPDPRRAGRISSADGARTSTRLVTSDTALRKNPGKSPKTSDWRSAATVGVGSNRIGVTKQLSNYPAFRVVYGYKPRNDDELELTEGDVIEVMERCEDGWFVGLSLTTNEFGTFPGNYVQRVCRKAAETK